MDDKTMASCPYCGQVSPYAVCVREQPWESEIRVAKLIDTAVAMLHWMKDPNNFYAGMNDEDSCQEFEELLKECGVSVDA